MNLLLKVMLPVLVLIACVATAKVVVANRPEPQTRPQFKSTTSIDATRIEKSDFPVFIQTQGTVSPSRQGSLVPEVSGSIISVSPNFVVGGSFRKDEVLLEIDPRDFEIALTLTEATFAQAKAALAEETARATQASEDWKRLGRKGSPSSLTLRKPQMAAAQATQESARAEVRRAQLHLDRTKIKASYDGSVSAKNVDLGQYVSTGSTLGEIHAIDTAEIRLPLNNQQLGFITLPGVGSSIKSEVTVNASVGGTEHTWNGSIVRSEGTIDPNSRQLFVVAQVDNPNNLASDRPPLRVGQYVKANIAGKVLKDVFVIPRSALREEREVLVVDELNTLQAKTVNVIWKDASVAVINDGLETGDVISLTALGSVTNGTRVRATIDGVAPPNERQRPNSATASTSQDDAQSSSKSTSGSDNPRMAELKTLIESGGELPQQAKQRFEAQIAANEPVPDWIRQHLRKTAEAK